jgi:hypothetical protein
MPNMTTIVTTLGPAFAVGLGIQHLNELLDLILTAMARGDPNKKKLFMGLSSLVFASIAIWSLDIRILQLLGANKSISSEVLYQFMDFVVTALVISTGTEGINSLVKFLGYAKDQHRPVIGQAAAGGAIRPALGLN